MLQPISLGLRCQRPMRTSRSKPDLALVPETQESTQPTRQALTSFAHPQESGGLDSSIAELHRIMQCRESSTPKHTFLGVSPPVRASGAANPMAQDRNWRSNAHKASNNNLQRLRELDAGGASFLRSFSTGDCLLLAPSPEPGSEDQSESDELFFGPFDSDKGEAESSRPTTHN
eukprot:jgi/Astpho2/6513/Aster-07301